MAGRQEGKLAVVTGASWGNGAAIAAALAREGAHVALAGRSEEKLEEARKGMGDKTLAVPTDVTDKASVETLMQTATSWAGKSAVDILVNCAGVMYFTCMKNCHTDNWVQMLDVNCKGVLHSIGAALQPMIVQGSGHIINISSDAARRMFPNLAVYCASKAFVQQIGEGLRREIVGTGLKVTDIQPGDVKTALVQNSGADAEAAELMGVTPGTVVGEGWANEWQVMMPEDVADSVIYAVTAPAHVAINEILVEPRDQS